MYLSFCILNILLLLCVCLSVFGNIIAIDADYSTDFKFHPTRGCSINSNNDVSQVAQRSVSFVVHTRHRSPYLPQPDFVVLFHFSERRPPPPSPTRISTEGIHGSRTGTWCIRPSPMHLLSCDTICDLQYFI